MRYAKGFIHTAEAISVGQSGTFRYRLIGLWGIRRYYQKRKGETLLSPAEQQQVVALARKLGVRLDEYFDGYPTGGVLRRLCRRVRLHMTAPVTSHDNSGYPKR